MKRCSLGPLRLLARHLAITALLLIAPASQAAPAPGWEDRLAATGLLPAECAQAIADFFMAPANPTGGGTPLERIPARPDGLFARLDTTGGLPFWGERDALVRVRSRFDAELAAWVPARDGAAYNRGYALWSPSPGRDLLVIDHMRSPISAATSIWEQIGRRVVLRAQFPAEIVHLENRDDAIVVRATDTFNALALSWDKRAGAFVGHCLVRMDAAAAAPEPIELPPSTLTVARLRRAAPLHHLPPDSASADNPRLSTLAKGERVIVLASGPTGAFVLAAWRDRTPLTALFRARPDRLWQVGWLAPETLASPPAP